MNASTQHDEVPRGLLMVGHLAGLASWRTILVAGDAASLLKAALVEAQHMVELAIDQHWEELSCVHLPELVYEYEEDRVDDEDLSPAHVVTRLATYGRLDRAEIAEGRTTSALGAWSRYLAHFAEFLPGEDWLAAPVEGTLPSFARRLFRHERRWLASRRRIPEPDEYALLGELACLCARSDAGWAFAAHRVAFAEFVDRYNARYGDV